LTRGPGGTTVEAIELPVTGGWVPARMGPRDASIWVVLTHGAGGTIDDPLTAGAARLLRARGIGALEATFLYRAAGRRMPDRMPVLERTLSEIVEQLRARIEPQRVFLAGKSMGGRVAARIAKRIPSVDGVCLLSYPLRPPSRVTEKNLLDREETLRTVDRPTLLVQGTRDPFGGPADVASLLPGARVVSVEGGDHDLATRGGRVSDATLEHVVAAIHDFVSA
jgi:uncharacterized protein